MPALTLAAAGFLQVPAAAQGLSQPSVSTSSHMCANLSAHLKAQRLVNTYRKNLVERNELPGQLENVRPMSREKAA
jgi:hypothetical protein